MGCAALARPRRLYHMETKPACIGWEPSAIGLLPRTALAQCNIRMAAPTRPRVVVLDVDAGIDDAQAIVAVVRSPEARSGQLKVAAITCVTGNVPVDEVRKNVELVLEACGEAGAGIPVFMGASRPLVADYTDATYWHGADGLGGARHRREGGAAAAGSAVAKSSAGASAAVAGSGDDPAEESAVSALVRLAREHRGHLEVLALGPLTTLAVAANLHPSLPSLLGRLVIMGGTSRLVGNMSSVLEYNFAADPEAAAAVLAPAAFGSGVGPLARPVELVPWETSMEHALPIAWCRGEDWLGAPGDAASLLREASELILGRMEAGGETAFPTADAVAAAVFLRPPGVVAGSITRAARVELAGSMCRGALVLDHRPSHVPDEDRAAAGPATGAVVLPPGSKPWAPEAGWGRLSVVTRLSDAAVRAVLAESVRGD